MKSLLLFLVIWALLGLGLSKAQTTVFSENFETLPLSVKFR